MCGVIAVGGPEGRELVARLVGSLAHRGPDDEGRWSCPQLALGHRRLTIIGLDAEGRQPMWSRSGDSVIVFNGEIYNYLELAKELDRLGRPCDRRFDTAVLLEALELWGVEALAKLNGMFAFAWYRPRAQSVLLARDRWGKKPLFWGTYPSTDGRRYLALSSELRTFARLPGGPPAPDPLGIARYMAYDGMPGERTVYAGVSKVPAASWLRLTPRGDVERRGVYWRFEPRIEPIDARAAGERVVAQLSHSLNLRLRSDVPVGLFLSGGLDSSILAALWRRQRPDDTIHTFTVGFENVSYDERPAARAMARAIGSEHHEFVISGPELEAELAAVLQHLSEPFADPSIIPTSLLCRVASRHVKVVIGGDGADELQAGYDPFRAWALGKLLTAAVPGGLWPRVFKVLERLTPPTANNMSLGFRLHHFGQGLASPPEDRIQAWLASFPVSRIRAMLKPDLAAQIDEAEILEPTRQAFRAARHVSELHAQIHAWIATYLEDSILTKIDRAGMMHSLEVRSPYLDPMLADGLLGLPPSLIFHHGKGKALLRQVARGLIPAELLQRRKKGLGVPLTTWFTTLLRDRLEDALERSKQEGWFRYEAIATLRDEHLAGHYDHRKALWNFLLSFPFQSNN